MKQKINIHSHSFYYTCKTIMDVHVLTNNCQYLILFENDLLTSQFTIKSIRPRTINVTE